MAPGLARLLLRAAARGAGRAPGAPVPRPRPGSAAAAAAAAAGPAPAPDPRALERALRRVNRRARLAETARPPAAGRNLAGTHPKKAEAAAPAVAGAGGAGVTHSVIFLHGFGDTGDDAWVEVAQIVAGGREGGGRVVVPTAAPQEISWLGDAVMHSWFEPRSFGRPWAAERVQERWTCTGHAESTRVVEDLVRREMAALGLPRDRIFLAGFSQGAALALTTGLRISAQEDAPLGGILVFSGYLPRYSHYSHDHALCETGQGQGRGRAGQAAVRTPIVFFHGDADPIVPRDWAEEAKGDLEAAGAQVDLHVFSMRHELCAPELLLARRWVAEAVKGAEERA